MTDLYKKYFFHQLIIQMNYIKLELPDRQLFDGAFVEMINQMREIKIEGNWQENNNNVVENQYQLAVRPENLIRVESY